VEKLRQRLPIIAREYGWQTDSLMVRRSITSAELPHLDEALLHQVFNPRSCHNVRHSSDGVSGPYILAEFDPRIGPSSFEIAGRLLDDNWTPRCVKAIVESNDTVFLDVEEHQIVRFSDAGRLNVQIAQNVASLMLEYFKVLMERSSIAWSKRQCNYKPIVMQRIGREWHGAKLL
jgi:hypothetical protein